MSKSKPHSHKQTNKNSAPGIPSLPANQSGQPISRRRALMILGPTAAGAAVHILENGAGTVLGNLLTPPIQKLKQYLWPHSSAIRQTLTGPAAMSPRDSTRAANVSLAGLRDQLFLRSLAPTSFVPPGHWMTPETPEGKIIPPQTPVEGGLLTYGHEAAVLKSISTFLNRERGVNWKSTDVALNLPPQHSEIILGSGQSNRRTQDFLGTPQEPSCPFHYTIREESTIVERFQYGNSIKAHRKVICNSAGEVVASPRDDNGKLVDDYLLVTRFPGGGDTTITIFSGLHGPGTRVTEKFFSSERLGWIYKLADFIGLEDEAEVPHFQAIFRASEFQTREDPTDSDVAAKLELLTDDRTRPRRITERGAGV